MTKILLISTTFEKKEDAERLGALLLDQKKIACAQITGPITSIYRWQGEVTTATEWVLNIKTVEKEFSAIEAFLKQEHPYQLPQIVAQEIPLSSKEYGHWVQSEVL